MHVDDAVALKVLTRAGRERGGRETGSVLAGEGLHPEVAAKIKQAFFTFEWEGSDLQKEFKKEGRFVAINHKSDWDVIRKIDAANGVSYDCK